MPSGIAQRRHSATIEIPEVCTEAAGAIMSNVVHLHVHSDYSPMEGVSSVPTLCEAARAQGATTLALTDTNGLYGAIRFLDAAQQAGLHPILGAELTDVPRAVPTAAPGGRGTPPPAAPPRAILLVKTLDGYANLCRLLSERHGRSDFDFVEAVERYRSGLIVISDDEPSLVRWSADSPEDLYVEVTPGPSLHDAVALSRKTGIPPVATNRVRFIHAHDFLVHRLLRAIALNTTLSRLSPSDCCSPTHWLMPASWLERQLPHLREALANTQRIGGACHTQWGFKDTVFPAFRNLPDEQAYALLRSKTYEGAVWRYGRLTGAITQRIERELGIIRQKRYANYFLVVDEIVREAPRTCGRGSVAASIISYCLGITHVDPIRHRLFFERFLNPGRRDPPDIDVDFPWDERDGIIETVFQRYGRAHAAMVANQNTLGLRAAIREVGKVFGMPAQEIGRTSSLILRRKDFLWFEDTPTADTWAKRLCRALRLQDPWPAILRLAVLAQHHFRHLSVHCGGLVIVPDEIRRYVPVEIAAKGVPVIQWEKDQTEEAGLVKIDLLGNRSLAVIRDALAAVHRNTGRTIDYATWDPIDDAPTRDSIRRGDTIGCFYIESPATRLLLRKLWGGMPADRYNRLDVFEYLVMVSSLVRPAANPFIEEFIRRAQGGEYEDYHPVLGDILEETHGIMVYQEDVTKVAMALADFSVEDADQLRKVISKKHKERRLRDYYRQFCEGAAGHGASPATVAQIWSMIMSFAGYSFCKPHSASYAQVSFKSAYLRVHHPAEFMAAVISNQGGFYSTFAYLSETRRMGLAILPPDVNASEWRYTGAGRAIRIGLMQVKTLTEAVGTRLVEERTARGPFRSFQDFLERVKPEPAQARTLIRAGCCDSLAGELTRPALLWRLYAAHGAPPSPLPIPDEYSGEQQRTHEAETLGLIVRCHPLDLYRDQIAAIPHITGIEIPRHVGRAVTLIGWLVTEKSVETKHGEPMEFATFEDKTALYDATLFPDVYRRCCHLLSTDSPYVVRGTVEEHFGVTTLTVHDLHCLESTRPARHDVETPTGDCMIW
jgi:error-prone DNA polymerase